MSLEERSLWGEADVQVSQCADCHWADAEGASCPAFPDGIPESVLLNLTMHDEVLPGQTGRLVFRAAGDHGINSKRHAPIGVASA